MYIHTVYLSSYSAVSPLTGNITIRDESSKFEIELSLEDCAEISAIGEKTFKRHQTTLISRLSQPLETNLLPARIIEDADFSEVSF